MPDGAPAGAPNARPGDAPLVRARRDPALAARVVRRTPLRYAAGADAALDRPAHVRAGSGLARLTAPAGERLAVVQDDANFLALVDPATGLADAVTLPAGVNGRRTFSAAEGTKAHKLDLEACCLVDDPAAPPNGGAGRVLLAFGSGSTDRREQVVLVEGLESGPAAGARVTVADASALYAALRAERAFAGAELNVEGAARLRAGGRDVVRLFARGNGAGNALGDAASATCDVDAAALLAYLRGPRPAGPPAVARVTRYDLGAMPGAAAAPDAAAHGGDRFGFTDAAPFRDGVLYVAAAEASVDVYHDGEVAGSAVGVIAEDGSARWAPVTDADGGPLAVKVEGVAFDAAGRLWAVVDQDDPDRPSELCLVALLGPWTR